MKQYFLIIALLIAIKAPAQKPVYVSVADSLRQTGNLPAALRAYHAIYAKNPQDTQNYYGFACALAANAEYSEAYKYLYLATDTDPVVLPLTDPALLNLRSNGPWSRYEDTVIKKTAARYGAIKKPEPARQLWHMKALDALYTHEKTLLENSMGKDAMIISLILHARSEINIENQKQLAKIVALNGWPRISETGKEAADAAALITAHAGIEFKKKYLPVIKSMCAEQEASWEYYALICDQILVGEHKKQLYGTQVVRDFITGRYSLMPIEDAPNVDKRRMELGLQPLSVYLAQWNISYIPAK